MKYFTFKKNLKAIVPDPIINLLFAFVHNFGGKAFDILTTLYNKFLIEGTWPSTWKSGIVISISKPGKDKFHTQGYRPITLLNTMSELL